VFKNTAEKQTPAGDILESKQKRELAIYIRQEIYHERERGTNL
jgi:hypothetical protein